MITDYSTLYRDFTKSELLDIAESLGLTIGETTSKMLVKLIMQEMIDNGVPDITDCSETILEFLVAAEITDIDGNFLDETQEESDLIPELDEQEPTNVPQCYGFEDARDPACNKCTVQQECRKQRMINRPPCFGKLFEVNDENCKVCIEAPFCKQVLDKVRASITNTKKG